jgi:hypothetical protein
VVLVLLSGGYWCCSVIPNLYVDATHSGVYVIPPWPISDIAGRERFPWGQTCQLGLGQAERSGGLLLALLERSEGRCG